MTDTSLLDTEPVAPTPPEYLGRGGVLPLRAPNTAFVYLCTCADGTRQIRRVVARGVCTREHEERVLNALSRGRYFLRAIAVGDGALGAGSADQAMACCELVSIAPTIAGPSDQRDVEALVQQLEAAALYGWNGRPEPV